MNSEKRTKIKTKIRAKIQGTATYPRLSVFKSNTQMYAQLIDDQNHRTLVGFSSMKLTTGTKIEKARLVGLEIAKLAKQAGIEQCKFDRNGYLYHGRVKAVADGAREGGLLI